MWKPAIINDIQKTRETVRQINEVREKLNAAVKVGKRIAIGTGKAAGVGGVGVAGYAVGKKQGKAAKKEKTDDSWEEAAKNVK